MEHHATEVKQTPDQVVGDQSQAAQKIGTKKAELKPSEAKKLIEFMEKNYQERVAKVQSFDEFYHAIFELMELFCEERGQVQYRIPDKEKLQQAYIRHHKTAGELKKDEFVKISKEMVGLDSFSFGKAATEFLLLLFGAPFCALVVKRVLPGLRGLSDDIVIPLATSGSVAYLVHTKKL
ncbi:uncharacterized protein LOC124668132 isoform X1 [Lolium rigidum]|uniref:uncharacterized protein LOC124668132 isoform X1 n=1 Tax=Lolium rigidum TaxID=89674 RepID=UPI001F5E1A1F|nr:uncharacterized protein LOC124668132 isoform X1 [Lolium rigidum]